MSKTYRALAIVAVVAPLVSIGSLLLSSYISLNHLIPPSPPQGDRWIPAIALPIWWTPAISSLAAPVIATFAAAVAAELRRWGWLAAFIALGALGVIGLTPLVTSLPFLSASFDNATTVGIYGLNAIVAGYSPMILLALVALLFALLPPSDVRANIKPGALALVVVVATLVSLVSIVWSTHNSYATSGSSFNSIGLPILNVGLAGIDQTTQVIVDISSLWDPVTNALAAPIIATLAIIVAAQARRWGWLVVFVVLDILYALGSAMIPELELRNVFPVNPSTVVVFGVGFYEALPMALLIIAALLFAAVAGRGQRHAATSAVLAPQAG